MTPARTARCSLVTRRECLRSAHDHHRLRRIGSVAMSAGAQAYLGARTVRPLGDMMIDGVPRGARCADAQSFEAVQHVVLAAVPFLERSARHQGSAGRTRRRPRHVITRPARRRRRRGRVVGGDSVGRVCGRPTARRVACPPGGRPARSRRDRARSSARRSDQLQTAAQRNIGGPCRGQMTAGTLAVRGVHRDVQPGVTHGVAGVGEPAGVAHL